MEGNMLEAKGKNKKFKKWLLIIAGGTVLIFIGGIVFNKFFWLGTITNYQNKVLMKNIAKYEQKYKDDRYGGKTPEETYAMFLDALKKKDIELASKYFVLDKQEQYKKALYEVDEGGKWESMMSDLTQKNIKGRYSGDTMYAMEFFDSKDEFLIQIDFILPETLLEPSKKISDIWKISTF